MQFHIDNTVIQKVNFFALNNKNETAMFIADNLNFNALEIRNIYKEKNVRYTKNLFNYQKQQIVKLNKK